MIMPEDQQPLPNWKRGIEVYSPWFKREGTLSVKLEIVQPNDYTQKVDPPPGVEAKPPQDPPAPRKGDQGIL